MYGLFFSVNLTKMNPESPRLKADRSLLLSTQMVAVALPGHTVFLKPNFRIVLGSRY